MPRPYVDFPDAVALVINFLRAAESTDGNAIGEHRVGDLLPYTVIRRVGGVAIGILDHPRIDVLTWAKTQHAASALATRHRSLLLYNLFDSVQTEGQVYSVSEFAGIQDVPDPASSTIPAVMFTVEVTTRGKVP